MTSVITIVSVCSRVGHDGPKADVRNFNVRSWLFFSKATQYYSTVIIDRLLSKYEKFHAIRVH